MKTLKEVFSAELPDFTNMGDEGRSVNRDRLVHTLDSLVGDLRNAYWIRLVVTIAVLVTLIILIFRFADKPEVLTGLTAIMGVTLAGAIAELKRVTDEMARVRLMLAIAPELSLEALTEIAHKISRSL